MKVHESYHQTRVDFTHYSDIFTGVFFGLLFGSAGLFILTFPEDLTLTRWVVGSFFSLLAVFLFFVGLFVIPIKTVYLMDYSTRELLKLSKQLVFSRNDRFTFDDIQTVILGTFFVKLVIASREIHLFSSPGRSTSFLHCRKLAETLAKGLGKDIIDKTSSQEERIPHEEIERAIQKQLSGRPHLDELVADFPGKITWTAGMIEISEFERLEGEKRQLKLVYLATTVLMLVIPAFLVFSGDIVPGTVKGFIILSGLGLLVVLLFLIVVGTTLLFSPVIVTIKPRTIQVGRYYYKLRKIRGTRRATVQLRDIRLSKVKEDKCSVKMVFDTVTYAVGFSMTKNRGEQLKKVILEAIKAVKG